MAGFPDGMGWGKALFHPSALGWQSCEGLSFAWRFPYTQVYSPRAHQAGCRESRASPGLPSRNGFSRGGAGREGPFPEPLGQTHCLPGRQQR